MIVLYSIITILLILVIILVFRLMTIIGDINHISRDLEDILDKDTNLYLTTNSGERSIKGMIDSLNIQLSKLQSAKREYSKGILDLKCSAENVVHDIRTPLTVIKGYVGLLEDERLSEDGKVYLEIIKGRVEYMKDLTDELFLSLSMKNRGIRNISEIDIKSVLEEALISFRFEFEKKKILPSLSLPSEKVMAKADAKALYRVYVNIISNAIKYGEGDLKVEMDRDGNTTFSNFAPNMDSIEANRLLDRYFTINDAKASSGIGLSISKEIVVEMGGKLKVRLEDNILYISITF